MRRREFIFGSVCLTATSFSLHAEQPLTVPFPNDAGRPPLRVPPLVAARKTKFPIPERFYVRGETRVLCEDKNVTREATIQQWTSDGTVVRQHATARYTQPSATAIRASLECAPIDGVTWISTDYAYSPILGQFNVIDKDQFSFVQVWQGREAFFFIAFAKTKDALFAPPLWLPPSELL